MTTQQYRDDVTYFRPGVYTVVEPIEMSTGQATSMRLYVGDEVKYEGFRCGEGSRYYRMRYFSFNGVSGSIYATQDTFERTFARKG